MIFKRALATVISGALIWASLPPTCFAAVEGSFSSETQFLGPAIVSNVATLNEYLADSLHQQSPELNENSNGFNSFSKIELAAAGYEAHKFLQQAQGPMSVEWEKLPNAPQQLKLTALVPSIFGTRLITHVIPVSKHLFNSFSEQEKVEIQQLADTLSQIPTPQIEEGALNEFWDSQKTVGQETAGSNQSATPILNGKATSVLKPSELQTSENSAPAAANPIPTETITNDATSWRQIPGNIWHNFKSLPRSFHTFLLGGSMLLGATEGICVIVATYGFKNFGLTRGLLTQIPDLAGRVIGSWLGVWLSKRVGPQKIYPIATVIQALALLSIPIGASYFGAHSSLFLTQYLIVQFLKGLGYGSTRGMAEVEMMPRILGQNKTLLENAGFAWMAATSLSSLIAAFGLTPLLMHIMSLNAVIAIMAGIMLLSSIILSQVEDTAPQTSQEKSLQESGTAAQNPLPIKEAIQEPAKGTQDRLPIREYIPFVCALFLHFAFYTLLSGLFGFYFFHSSNITSWVLGTYDLGSFAVGMITAILVMALSRYAKPAAHAGESQDQRKTFLDAISPKTWLGITILTVAIYFASGVLGWQILNLVAVGALGALITILRTVLMASYLSRLKTKHHRNAIATLNSMGFATAILPILAIAGASAYGVAALTPILIGTGIAIGALLCVAYLFSSAPETAQHTPDSTLLPGVGVD